ncbi:hypothetical protein PAXRUDRAFT_324845 [Paxillus rubicundulus Ve08.2h10]|uniref:Uncharacterized protein n=1 Tax=Paxillus rubicundulus Ve08.2h10 TaxID=930991 RepID=A0A0D0E9Z8_9AGAM|nr:hypothetical protein PAXRUDRAFT_324845 [Paxillus rubicundulus Ve08.2h10]
MMGRENERHHFRNTSRSGTMRTRQWDHVHCHCPARTNQRFRLSVSAQLPRRRRDVG